MYYLLFVKVDSSSDWIYYGMVTADILASELNRLNRTFYSAKCETGV